MALLSQRFHRIQILPFILFLCSTFSFSHVAAELRQSSLYGRWEDGMLPSRRFMAEEASTAKYSAALSTDDKPFILAANRTNRVDPTNSYQHYTGGWNITDSHYLASVTFTAAPLFGTAIAWFFGFGLVLLIACCCCICCRRQRSHSYSHACHALALALLFVLTCAEIISCIVLYNGQGKFHNSTVIMLDYMEGETYFIVDNLHKFANKMAGAKKVGVGHIFLPGDLQTKIDNIITKLNISAAELSSKTSASFKNIDEALNTVQLDMVITAAIMLVLAILGFLFSILGLQVVVYFLVILGWILVTCTLITSGVFLLVHNVVGDTCVAMDEWVAKPHAHTALGDLIPCVNAATANESLSRSKEVTFELIQVVNDVILNVSNANFPSRIFNPPFSYNQSGPPMPILCNPYKPDLTDRKCRPGEVSFDDASMVWKRFICNTKVVAGSEICSSVGRITPSMYNEMTGATNMSQGLYLYVPFLFKIADCTVARETFGSISSDYCPGVELHSKTIVLGLVVVSTTMMLSIIFWMILAKQRKHRRYSMKYTNQEGPLMAGYKL